LTSKNSHFGQQLTFFNCQKIHTDFAKIDWIMYYDSIRDTTTNLVTRLL